MSIGKRKQRKQDQAKRKSAREVEEAQRKANDNWYDKKDQKIIRRSNLALPILRKSLLGLELTVAEDHISYRGVEINYAVLSGDGDLVSVTYGSSSEQFRLSEAGIAGKFTDFCDKAISKKLEQDSTNAGINSSGWTRNY